MRSKDVVWLANIRTKIWQYQLWPLVSWLATQCCTDSMIAVIIVSLVSLVCILFNDEHV